MKNIGILLFDNIDLLDITGPYEVFSLARTEDNQNIFKLSTVAQTKQAISTWSGFNITPVYCFSDFPKPDILFVPGGIGTRTEIGNNALIQFIKDIYPHIELVISVCTGALLLAKAGLLKGLRATTHHSALNLLSELEPTASIEKTERYVDNGKIILSAGISAGIDMSFYIIKRLYGKEMAKQVAEHMEYRIEL
ncbi:MAG: DJ-1/PfpI family protein [Spirochaetales bacterium]|nr:DJ-1/PfpI family protein [Spirochaetales bacterium]